MYRYLEDADTNVTDQFCHATSPAVEKCYKNVCLNMQMRHPCLFIVLKVRVKYFQRGNNDIFFI